MVFSFHLTSIERKKQQIVFYKETPKTKHSLILPEDPLLYKYNATL